MSDKQALEMLTRALGVGIASWGLYRGVRYGDPYGYGIAAIAGGATALGWKKPLAPWKLTG